MELQIASLYFVRLWKITGCTSVTLSASQASMAGIVLEAFLFPFFAFSEGSQKLSGDLNESPI